MQQPRIACIGAGYWGRNVVRNIAGLGVLDAICEADAGTRESMSASYPDVRIVADPSDVLNDPGIAGVCIATPAETHGALVRAALLAGKDVLVEKPLCLSVDEGEELVRLAEETGRVLMVGHLLWYHPGILELKRLIDAGELGRLQYVYSNRLNLGKIRREENILWSFAPHDISVLLGLIGEEPATVEARGGNYLHNEIADVTLSILSFPSGVKGHVFVSWLHPFKEQKLVVVGDRQMAVFDDVEKQDKLVLYPHTIAWRNGQPTPNKAEGKAVPLDAAEPLRAECAHFVDCVRTRATPRTDGREGVRVLRVLDACQRSLGGQGADATAVPRTTAKPSYFLHESSYADDGVEIGEGTSIWHFSHILKNTTLGRDCRIGQNVVIGPNVTVGRNVKIQNNVSVYEGVTLEDNVFCGPSMVFTNVYNPRSEIRRMDELRPTLVREGASLGANCTVVCGITIGEYAFVGAGAVVHRDVPNYALVVGNPGRIIGFVCRCGNRIDFEGDTGECRSCGMAYGRTGESVAQVLSPVAG